MRYRGHLQNLHWGISTPLPVVTATDLLFAARLRLFRGISRREVRSYPLTAVTCELREDGADAGETAAVVVSGALKDFCLLATPSRPASLCKQQDHKTAVCLDKLGWKVSDQSDNPVSPSSPQGCQGGRTSLPDCLCWTSEENKLWALDEMTSPPLPKVSGFDEPGIPFDSASIRSRPMEELHPGWKTSGAAFLIGGLLAVVVFAVTYRLAIKTSSTLGLDIAVASREAADTAVAKMKQRFSSLDVKVIAHELSEALVSLRLANIYDLNSKILLFKFAKPDNRQQLLIESGFRCHLTDFARSTAPAPSAFVARLRKFLKTRRVTKVSQIGTDRIIEFQFSDGAYRVYLEFFASGNVILTDADLTIIALLRNVPEGEGQEPQQVGLKYTLENRQNYGGVPELTKERLRAALKAAAEHAGTKKAKKKGADELRRGLATTITELPPVLVDHVFRLTEFNSAAKPAEILESEALLDSLFQTLEKARSVLEEVTSSPRAKGHIIAKPNPRAVEQKQEERPGAETQKEKPRSLLYEDFQPFLPRQFEDDKSLVTLSFDGYNKTVDEFFSSLEGQRLESKLQEREATAKRKLEAARQDQAKRIEGLVGFQMLNLRKAAAIEANIERVQEAMDAVNGLLEQGMDWVNINKLVEREQAQGNPVAEIIKLPMNLAESSITLLLGEEEEEEAGDDEDMEFNYDTDEETVDAGAEPEKAKGPDKRLEIDINLKLSVWNNAREYYDQKRTAADKEKKTVEQSVVALKNAEQKITEDLRKGLKQEKPVLQPIRKQMWFEKFTWFISSDGYLVLGGRDAQQNEILYKRYLRKGDVYVHADMHGASTVIIKNSPRTPDAPIPPSTLAQAGNLSVCCSSAWDSKAAMGAWWVNADQVSKSAPTGEYLPAGSFMVRGKKNPLPPALLMLGFGLMFRISEESKARHVKHRLYDGDVDLAPPSKLEKGVEQETAAPEQDTQHEDSGSDDEEGPEDETRSNPLQSGGKTQPEDGAEDGRVPEEAPEPPAEQLSNLDVAPSEEPKQEPEPIPDSDDDSDHEEGEDTVSQANTPSKTGTSTASQPSSQNKKPLKRGQRSKAKKIAQKYKDQDEDDRALMEELLGVAAARKKAEAEAAAKKQKELDHIAAVEKRKKQQERQQAQIAKHEEIRKVMLEEGVDILDEHEKADVGPLDSLVGTPMPGDEILEAVPVCGPWGALGKLKYKVKLQPGQVKKGKAVKEIFERWKLASGKKGVVDQKGEDGEKMWPREVELIRGVKVEEVLGVVPVGKVTVMAGGGMLGGGGAGDNKKGGGGGGGGQSKGGKGKGGGGGKKGR
ncbi:fibronectin-binding protein A N-terminus-domain-containing protein [Triangularia setosa]|uniref:Ribosome quality control complex subunit 2 n=1 Tax=Triangularia setosa TaxID=2587417 RepID=A0AAN6WE24_9PEZI|nr:fibronectin-binding protein A N-terminus-domain-containing protein [Podospora setosa]